MMETAKHLIVSELALARSLSEDEIAQEILEIFTVENDE
jgi:RNA polymerase-interacting CarD/CdnL/TRCF family regulator